MHKIHRSFPLTLFFSVAAFAQIPTNGLVAYYPFHGNVIDSSGNGNNATIVGSVSFGADRFGSANSSAYIPGAGSYIDCGSTLVPSAPNTITLCAWIKTQNASGVIFAKRNFKTFGDGWLTLTLSNGKAQTYIDLTGYTEAQIDSSKIFVNDDAWHFLCSVKNDYLFMLYVDGVLQQTVTDTTTFSSTDDFDIGHEGANNFNYIGYVNDVRLYNRVLSQAEITALYTTPSFLTLPTNSSLVLSSTLELSWMTIPGAASYGLQVSTVSNFSSTISNQYNLTSTSATISGLSPRTTYYWKEYGVEGATSAWSNVWSFTTAAFLGLPQSDDLRPGDTLTFQCSGADSFALMADYHIHDSLTGAERVMPTLPTLTYWQTVSNNVLLYNIIVPITNFPDSLDLYRQQQFSTDSLYFVVYSSPGNDTLHDPYWPSYYVLEYGNSLPQEYTIASQVPLGVPVLSSPTNGASSQATTLTMSWGAVIGAATYSVLVSAVSTFATTVSGQSGLTSLSASVSGLANSTTYYWRVIATNVAGKNTGSSLWSFTTIPSSAVLPQKYASLSKGISFSNSAITYELSARSSVTIALYDMQGRQVRQLVNGMQNAGSYKINFSRDRVTAGYYIVEFKAGAFVVQKKLVLIE